MILSSRRLLLGVTFLLAGTGFSCSSYTRPHSPQLVDEVYDQHRNRELRNRKERIHQEKEVRRQIHHENERVE